MSASRTQGALEFARGLPLTREVHTHHFQGTNRMLPKEDGGVVDTQGQVYGTLRLRVADISTSPIPVDGNTAGPAYLVGYKIAQSIKTKFCRQ